MSPRLSILKTLRVLAGALALPVMAAALGTPAGTSIVNQASSVFLAPDSGLSLQATSNPVQMTVQPVCALSISPDGTVAQPASLAAVQPGEQIVFPYRLVNAGNATHTFALAGRVESGSSLTPTLRIVLDANANGQADAAEADVNAVTLAADARADLLLIMPASAAQGEAWINLTGACAGGQVDENNVSQVRVGPPADLSLSKTFSPTLVRPGSETAVSLRVVNGGAGPSRGLLLTDLLAAQASQGLSFVPGSAVASGGSLEYSADGTTWSAAEPSPVRGVRLRLDSLAPGAELRLDFRMLAGSGAENRVIGNTATLDSGPLVLSATASADVRYQPGVAIGPRGNARAAELGPDDQQTRPFAALDQPVCFDHTVENTGDVRDDFTLAVSAAQATVTLSAEGGAPLAQPLALEPGQSSVVRVCYVVSQAGPLDALVTVRGRRGTQNATRDRITQVEGGLPDLRKSAVATTTAVDGSTVILPAGATVTVGDTVTYTVSVHNPYTHALSQVTLTDAVPAHLDVVSTDGGVVTGGPGQTTVRWSLTSLAPDETRTLSLVTRVSTRAVDGEFLTNTFSFSSSELAGPLVSNEVRLPVWSAQLLVSKAVSTREATYGDLLTYTLEITNASATTEIQDALVTDTPVAGLEYRPGSSAVDGEALADPDTSGGRLRWTLARLKAGQIVRLTYQMRVTPAASGDLVNSVEVTATGGGGVARAIASNRAVASTRLNPLKFAPLADIVGVVFVDRNRNGLYDEGLDTPVPRARLLLAGGRQAVTDSRGRYSFLNVSTGTQVVRLDPGTTPYPPLHVARDGGLSGTQTAFLTGLTSLDFPLAPLGGDITALRRTTLLLGDVRVEKSVYAVPGGYQVSLRLQTPRPLEGVEFTDPLPAGAVLKEGRNSLAGSLPAGEQLWTYRFEWQGDARAATTDPVLRWRR